jgi:uncharacterized protein (DUF952 family)
MRNDCGPAEHRPGAVPVEEQAIFTTGCVTSFAWPTVAYGDVGDHVILVIDSAKASAPVRHEASQPGAEEYPTVCDALPLDAVTGVITVNRDAAGLPLLPE